MSRYMVFDEETETHHTRKRKANPFDKRNWAVARGWKFQGDKCASWSYHPTKRAGDFLHIPDDITLLVGHNIKFDLLYEKCAGNPELIEFFKRGGKIWCTQYAQYLLMAQDKSAQYCAMDDIAPSYGGRVKIDGMKALWEAGVLTSDISPDLIQDYLIGTEAEGRDSGDIGNTEKIFLGQIKEVIANDMLPSVQARMDGLACTTEMEFNGIKVSIPVAKEQLAELEVEQEAAAIALDEYVPELPDGLVFNWNSNTHKSCILFGGHIKYSKQAPYIDEATGEYARLKAKAKWPLFGGEAVNPELCELDTAKELYISAGQFQDVYKSGKKKGQGKFKNVDVPGEIKVKFQDYLFKLDGYTFPLDEWAGATTDGNGDAVYGTGSDIIERLGKRNVPFLKVMARNQSLNKEIGTYYIKCDPKTKESKGMLCCVDPDTHVVHHSLNHVATVTTRLSSSDPNLQNIPRGDKSNVKRMFISRFTKAYCEKIGIPFEDGDGEVLEADYSQLEVVVQGLLSRDTQLCADIRSGIDFHCKRVALKNNVSYENALYWCKDEDYPEYLKWKAERSKCKIFSFQRAYGAGPGLIAEETGMDIDEVKSMIKLEDAAYPGVVKFNESVEAACNASAVMFKDGTRGWRVFRRGQWQAPTGTIYQWRSYDAPAFLRKRGVTDTFKPTELKNYPVQGTGGEIVQIILGRLWRRFVETGNYGGRALLVNTVHDCIWIDMHKSVRKEVIADVRRIMQSVPEVLKELFNWDCPVPFPVDVETGANMLELHHAA